MTNEQDHVEVANNEELVLDLDTNEEAPVEEKKEDKPEFTLEQKLARVKRMASKLEKELGVVPEVKQESKPTGKLDETQLDYLDLKGVSEEDDIKVIETVMKNTGKSLRDALKDPYVVSTLDDNRSQRNVRGAIPNSSKRGGVESNSVDFYVNKFKSTGQLPKDFETQSKVVEAIAAETDNRKPNWMR